MRWYHYLKISLLLCLVFVICFVNRDWILGKMQVYEYDIQRGAGAVTILGGVVGIITLIFIWLQLVYQANQARLARTYQYSEKLQNREFLSHLSCALIFLKDKTETEEERWRSYLYDTLYVGTAYDVYIALAFFEDIAMLYNENNISRKLVRRLLKTTIIEYYEESAWFRKRMKNEYGNSMYKELDLLYKKLNGQCWWRLWVKKTA